MVVDSTVDRSILYPITGILLASYTLMYPASMLLAFSGGSMHPGTLFFFLFLTVSLLYSLYDYLRVNRSA